MRRAPRAARLLRDIGVYRDVSKATGVPALWPMATNERESGGRLDRYLGNGERLDRVTRLVPKGRGPFRDWTEGAIDALRLDAIERCGTRSK